ncbi:MAG: TolB-like 6-bladed beta-propeller domain-containing protein [Prevotellaceae bacterium]|jgi:hypothetical protein|nr:TolB-like 6-bladed beta-propeller domain-containing protein [Prevotellaceae bacterium]
MKSIRLLLLSIVVTALNNCSDKKNFVTGSMKTIHFDKEYTVAGEHLSSIDSIGVSRVMVLGQYLIQHIYSQKCFVKIYDLQNMNFTGDFLYKGKGPGEVLSAVFDHVKFPYLWIDDINNRNLKIIDIPETVNDGQASIKSTIKYSYDGFADPEKVLYVNDTLLWVKSFDRDRETMSYFKYNPVEKKIRDEIKLYNYPITSDIRYQKMTVLCDCIKPDGSKIVMSTGDLDQLDIIDLAHPGKSISLTQRDHLFDYEYIKYSENMKTFYSGYPSCSDRFIYVLYRSYEIHIIDWDGNSVCKLLLDRKLRDCTIDFDSGFMYAVSNTDEKTYRYDIRNILKEIS